MSAKLGATTARKPKSCSAQTACSREEPQPKLRSGHEDRALRVELQPLLAPVREQELAEARALDPLQVLLGDDLIGVDVGAVEHLDADPRSCVPAPWLLPFTPPKIAISGTLEEHVDVLEPGLAQPLALRPAGRRGCRRRRGIEVSRTTSSSGRSGAPSGPRRFSTITPRTCRRRARAWPRAPSSGTGRPARAARTPRDTAALALVGRWWMQNADRPRRSVPAGQRVQAGRTRSAARTPTAPVGRSRSRGRDHRLGEVDEHAGRPGCARHTPRTAPAPRSRTGHARRRG